MTYIHIPRTNGGTTFVKLCGNVFPWVLDENGSTIKYLIHFDDKLKIIPVSHLDETNNGKFQSGEYPRELEEYFQKQYGKSATALAKYLDQLDNDYTTARDTLDSKDPTPGNIMRLYNVKLRLYRERPLLFYSVSK